MFIIALSDCHRTDTRKITGGLWQTLTKEYEHSFPAQFQRLRLRRGGKKAIIAVGHTLLIIVFHVLKEEKDYQELGGNYFDQADHQAVQKRLVHRLKKLGYDVTLTPASPAA